LFINIIFISRQSIALILRTKLTKKTRKNTQKNPSHNLKLQQTYPKEKNVRKKRTEKP